MTQIPSRRNTCILEVIPNSYQQLEPVFPRWFTSTECNLNEIYGRHAFSLFLQVTSIPRSLVTCTLQVKTLLESNFLANCTKSFKPANNLSFLHLSVFKTVTNTLKSMSIPLLDIHQCRFMPQNVDKDSLIFLPYNFLALFCIQYVQSTTILY